MKRHPGATPIDLSVIVAAVEADRTIPACLTALHIACEGVASEVIMVHPGDEALAGRILEAHPDVRLLSGPRAALTPQLWALGLERARGAAVAFTTAHCVVSRNWARALLEALARGATGAGGALHLGTDTGVVDWAVYLLRYSAFLPSAVGGEAAEIPGDNAAYLRTALERHSASFGDGFWEVEFHRRIRGEQGRLVSVPDATASFGPAFSFASIFRQRFLHGCHFGAYRVSTSGASRWRALAAPVVPFLLAARVLRRALPRPELRVRALLALPVLLLLAAAWAAGEAWGALHARPAPALRRSLA